MVRPVRIMFGAFGALRVLLAGPVLPEKGTVMLGIEDKWVFLAYSLSIISTLFCVAYGVLSWNKGDEPVKQEDVQWMKEEVEEVEEVL